MLPVSKFDDKTFEQFVQDAGRLIRNHAPRWTDENLHDPGITFVELFAWLTEMQQFFLDQIGEKNYLKFLKLLGIKLRKAVPATVDVSFNGVAKPLVIPEGTRLLAGELPFETDKTIYLTPSKIDKVLVKTATGSYDFTSSNFYDGISYHTFGEAAEKGSCLYIGFDKKLPSEQNIDLTFDLLESYRAQDQDSENGELQVIPSAKLNYRFFGTDNKRKDIKPDWLPISIIRDETVNLLRSGRLSFKIQGEMSEALIYPANDRERFWISLTIEEDGYEFPPKAEKIKLNTIGASQRESICQMVSFCGTGKSNQSINSSTFLSFLGKAEVQIREDNGEFRYWKRVKSFHGCSPEDKCYIVKTDAGQKKLTICFGDGQQGRIPPSGDGNIRLISHLPALGTELDMGKSNGLCYQKFKVNNTPVISKSFILQTGIFDETSGEYLWYDWSVVEDFDSSGPQSRHFLLDEETGEITFGDNLRGMVPEIGAEDNIRIISCQTGGGAGGNIHRHQIEGLADMLEDAHELSATNEKDAKYGRERETVESAIIRVRKELKKPYSAVTPEDYEKIALSIPGVSIARAKAFPLYAPGLKKYPEKTLPAQMTVVVVPFSNAATPVPSKGLLATVKKYLDRRRLVTTELHVTGPAYVKVSVHAIIAGDTGSKINSEKVAEALNSLLCSLDTEDGQKGWAFGRTVFKSDIYGFVKGIEGVESIRDLWLEAEGAGIELKPNGDIAIPPSAIVYSGRHEIEILGREN